MDFNSQQPPPQGPGQNYAPPAGAALPQKAPYPTPYAQYPSTNYPVKSGYDPYPPPAGSAPPPPGGQIPYPGQPSNPGNAPQQPGPSGPPPAPPAGASSDGVDTSPSAPPMEMMDNIEGYGRNSFDNGQFVSIRLFLKCQTIF